MCSPVCLFMFFYWLTIAKYDMIKNRSMFYWQSLQIVFNWRRIWCVHATTYYLLTTNFDISLHGCVLIALFISVFVNNPTGELLLLYQKKGKNWNYFLEFVVCPYICPKRAPLDHPFMGVSKGDVNQCLAKPDLGRLWAGLLPDQLRLWVRLCALYVSVAMAN